MAAAVPFIPLISSVAGGLFGGGQPSAPAQPQAVAPPPPPAPDLPELEGTDPSEVVDADVMRARDLRRRAARKEDNTISLSSSATTASSPSLLGE